MLICEIIINKGSDILASNIMEETTFALELKQAFCHRFLGSQTLSVDSKAFSTRIIFDTGYPILRTSPSLFT